MHPVHLEVDLSNEDRMNTRRRETLTAQLVRQVADRIKSGEFPRGARLPTEKEMIDEFGVSRTVVREAIANLRAEGMVSTQQGMGAFVVQNTPLPAFRIAEEDLSVLEEVVKGLELRIAVESEAAALAAQRRNESDIVAIEVACDSMADAIKTGSDSIEADLNFHRAIARASRNDHFLKIFNYLGEVSDSQGALAERTVIEEFTLSEYLERINSEHQQVLLAIRRGDTDGARATMRMHLSGSRDRLQQTIPVGNDRSGQHVRIVATIARHSPVYQVVQCAGFIVR